ncbi:MAG: MBL fold metallo-hydrolase, partial [Rhodomicrobium sp.]|nr:MBL fold metallo-hydrolase [Rhodomicrobium sp.]
MLFDRRKFLAASAGAAAANMLGLRGAGEAFAKAPFAAAQVPAYYRLKIGTLEVTAITDGTIELPLSAFQSADKAEAQALLAKAHRPELAPTAVNTYVINTGEKLILVDSGYGNIAGPDTGRLPDNLKAAGFEPEQFDAVFVTHMHPDHVGGLLDGFGEPAFANATLLVGDKEYAFWTDEGAASRAPANMQRFFKMAQTAVTPYGKRLQRYKDGEEIAPGIAASAAPGHTPGHSTLRISSGKDTLFIWGDIVHSAALQFARPEWTMAFDTDQAQAGTTRKKLFDQLSADGTLVAGMHLDFPGLGYVTREAQGYSYQRAV